MTAHRRGCPSGNVTPAADPRGNLLPRNGISDAHKGPTHIDIRPLTVYSSVPPGAFPHFSMPQSALRILLLAAQVAASQVDYAEYVYLFLGAGGEPDYVLGGGDVSVGSTLSFGVVKLG